MASFEVQITIFKLPGGAKRLADAVQVTMGEGADGSEIRPC